MAKKSKAGITRIRFPDPYDLVTELVNDGRTFQQIIDKLPPLYWADNPHADRLNADELNRWHAAEAARRHKKKPRKSGG
jgi:hypothetical protein